MRSVFHYVHLTLLCLVLENLLHELVVLLLILNLHHSWHILPVSFGHGGCECDEVRMVWVNGHAIHIYQVALSLLNHSIRLDTRRLSRLTLRSLRDLICVLIWHNVLSLDQVTLRLLFSIQWIVGPVVLSGKVIRLRALMVMVYLGVLLILLTK